MEAEVAEKHVGEMPKKPKQQKHAGNLRLNTKDTQTPSPTVFAIS
jgi:hypothetical protein